jgi:oligopeptide transport system permease protein
MSSATADSGPACVPAPAAGRGPWREAWRRLRKNPLALAGGVFLVVLVLACFAGPRLFDLDPTKTNVEQHNQAPSGQHWFGTDNLGRDYLARVLVGGQVSLLIGLVGAIVVVLVGTTYGSIAGYRGGRVDDAMMRFVDFMYGIPYMFLVILIMLMFDESDRGDNPVPVFAALGLVQWLTMARIVRGQVMSLRHREFVLAAKTMGASPPRILLRHVLPNCLGVIVVYGTLTVPQMILTESFLSYLGLGSKISWGVLVSEGVAVVNPIRQDTWLLLFPSLFIAVTLLSLNFLGDGLRDAIDPKSNRA